MPADRTIDILAEVCADMQAEMLQGVAWPLPHGAEFQRRARERLAAVGIAADPADATAALTRIADALERIDATLAHRLGGTP